MKKLTPVPVFGTQQSPAEAMWLLRDTPTRDPLEQILWYLQQGGRGSEVRARRCVHVCVCVYTRVCEKEKYRDEQVERAKEPTRPKKSDSGQMTEGAASP